MFIKTDLALDALAAHLREVLNLRDQNRTAYLAHQGREGANYGGRYYVFEVLGLRLFLLRNAGEAVIPGQQAYPYYLYVEGRIGADEGTLDRLTLYLRDVLRDAGLDAEVNAS